MKRKDRELGMDRDITRRDFLSGVNIAVSGSLLATPLTQALAALEESARSVSEQMMPGYYPPTREGLRGSHPGSFEVAHSLRDGAQWNDADVSEDTGEEYDLIVVGGGISGLAAAYFYQKEAGPDAKILIVDNHDDFGGHAKRNEFRIDGKTVISYGGSQTLESPQFYSDTSKALLRDIGVEVERLKAGYDLGFFRRHGLASGIFFDRATYGVNRVVRHELVNYFGGTLNQCFDTSVHQVLDPANKAKPAGFITHVCPKAYTLYTSLDGKAYAA